MPFCDNCGFELKPDDLFCPSCGKENVNRGPAKGPGAQPTYTQPPQQYQQGPPPQYQQPPQQYQPQYQQPGYQPPQYGYNVKRAVNAPFNYRLAPIGDRCVAYIIDQFIGGIGMCFCYIPGILYLMFKDGIRNGQSFGKGSANIRVVNFNTGMPATPLESCIRNCCNLCVCYLLIEQNQRHIGDLIAGTIVIKDE